MDQAWGNVGRRPRFDQPAMGESLHDEGHHEDEDQAYGVHAGASSGPAGEEYPGVLPPEYGSCHVTIGHYS